MTTIRRFCCNDLLRFASVNLDHLTETFNMSFYMTYLARWPDYFHVAEGPGKRIMGYIMGKVEGQGESWHGHVTAVTVAPEYRRQQLAKKLMNLLEDISDKIDKAYFVDLFVRASNTPAIKMYEKLGYVIYRRVLRYYSGEEDGLDMRKALSRDIEKKSIIPLKRPVTPDELDSALHICKAQIRFLWLPFKRAYQGQALCGGSSVFITGRCQWTKVTYPKREIGFCGRNSGNNGGGPRKRFAISYCSRGDGSRLTCMFAAWTAKKQARSEAHGALV
ncbi:Acyl-CoA N-acyltransferases superfamily protein [Theobroma cacao]|uniref:Acyl-CoA N-acyltransferases superfamily protein n=1 Tax=Theobroma cacao TaxID=3641 RepID=A0A061DPX9_THECC|nr:Acyl-CoA N-acyltransferases superfamily protein [Theobroma cacao]